MNLDSRELFDHIGERKTPTKRRPGVLTAVLACVMVVIIGRGAYLQVIKGESFRERAEYNRVDNFVLPAPRGIIYDKNRVQLVENISSTDLVFDPRTLPTRENESHLLDRLTQLFPDIAPETIHEALERTRTIKQETLIAKAIDHDTVLKIEQEQADIPGVKLVSSLVRKYPFKEVFAHVLGYTSPVTSEELSKDDSLIAIDATGKQGIEQEYDTALRGQHGITYTEVTASGKQKTALGEKPVVAGQDITLTIDSELQQFAYGLLSDRDAKSKEKGGESARGAIIVMNPKTGSVLSLVSYPSFDPNIFSQPSLRVKAQNVFQDPLHPLFNRAVDGTYPSGSIIKPFLAASALQEGIITPQTTVLSTGAITVGPWRFADWKAGGHGITDVKKALAESVNTFFYMVAGGLDSKAGLGVNKSISYLREFGWDEKTGIDLPSEAAGFLPSPEWKLKTIGQPWYIGDTYHLGIGQGNVLVTPIQIAAATGAIANTNVWYSPHLTEGTAKQHSISIKPEHIRVVQEGMRQAVTSGSARVLDSLAVPVAGKTGTAQIGGTEKTHAWFSSFGPYNNPEFVVLVLLEEGGDGDKEAVPVAKEVWQWIIEHYVNKT